MGTIVILIPVILHTLFAVVILLIDRNVNTSLGLPSSIVSTHHNEAVLLMEWWMIESRDGCLFLTSISDTKFIHRRRIDAGKSLTFFIIACKERTIQGPLLLFFSSLTCFLWSSLYRSFATKHPMSASGPAGII